MGRLKKDHSGWRTHGLWKKYQQPTAVEQASRHKGKKNTRKWCKGKVGVEHALVRRFKHYGWASRRSAYTYTVCTVCSKEFYRNKTEGIPLEIEIDESNGGVTYPVQVKVNGVAVPIDYKLYHDDRYFCYPCDEWHFS